MRSRDLKSFPEDKDFKDFAKQAVFYKIDCFYKQEMNVDEVKSILSQDDSELE